MGDIWINKNLVPAQREAMASRVIANSYTFVHSVTEAKIITLLLVTLNNNQLLKRRLLISLVHL